MNHDGSFKFSRMTRYADMHVQESQIGIHEWNFFTRYHLFRESNMCIVNDTVDGWNRATAMYETVWKMHYFPYQLVQDFFQEQ